MIVFLLSGLWHGAAWTYVIWGGLNGFYLVFALWTKGFREKITHTIKLDRFPSIQNAVKVIITFNLICFSWVFFRATSFTSARFIIKKIFTDFSLNINLGAVGITRYQVVLCLCVIALLLIVQLLQRSKRLSDEIAKKPVVLRWGLYYAGLVLLIIFGVFSTSSFIYFQF